MVSLKKLIMLSVTILLLASIALTLQIRFQKSPIALERLKAKVYKTPYCDCCNLHIGYMQGYGVEIEVIEMEDISEIKKDLGVPKELWSCHTTVIDNYFVEGHVPVEAISELIKEKPDIKGISLPGMPLGSPGMPGAKKEPFVIYSVDEKSYSEFMII